jgi:hypothetical protein
MAASTFKSLLAASLIQTAVGQVAAVEQKAGCSESGCAGYYRGFVATTSPLGSTFGPPSTVTGISVAAVGFRAAANASAGVARLDVAGFKFKNPADMSDGQNQKSLSFYFGYLGVGGVWDNTTSTAAIQGAAAEVVSSISSINVWYNRDNVEGFQWNLDAKKDVFNCATGTGYDCVDTKGTIDAKDLVWGAIERTEESCNSAAGVTTYDANCKINTFNTSGAHSSAPNVPVLTITARLASQPIMINGAKITADNAKFDVKIDYPWDAVTGLADKPNARVALVAVHAGKTASGVATVKVNDGKSVTFAAAAGKAAYFSYTSTAKIAGTNTNIVTQTVTGAEISAFVCASGDQCAGLTVTAAVMVVLKTAVAWLGGLGWETKLTIHSFATTTPASIFWDPEVGVSSTTQAAEQSGVAQLAPGLVLAALVAMLF